MNLTLTLALCYIIGLPILQSIIFLLQNELIVKREIEKNARRPKALKRKTPKKLSTLVRERIAFTIRDHRTFSKPKNGKPGRGPQNRHIFFLILLAGLVIFISPSFGMSWWALLVGSGFYLSSIIFSFTTSAAAIKMREDHRTRVIKIMERTIGVDRDIPEKDLIKVESWEDDLVTPKKIRIKLEPSFNTAAGKDFMLKYNHNFKTNAEWVAKDPDNEENDTGWDRINLVLTITSAPPLPTYREWSEHYVLSEGVAWSFFPIAIGIDGGLELPNPDTGLKEHVIGFDVAGQQKKVADRAGLRCSPSLGMAASQILVGGRTGSGKSLPIDTPIRVFNERS